MTSHGTLELNDLADTTELGRRLGNLLFPGAILALIGPLGAGKTHLVRALAEGLGVADSRVVSSPTFVLIQEYMGRLPLFHFDAYRLRGAEEFAELGAHEYFEANGVSVVEWADRVASALPPSHLKVGLTVTGDTRRHVEFHAFGDSHMALLRSLLETYDGLRAP